ncbi:hypothetical protein [Congregibacter litoralis]|uniref:Uncharacterized protein n=1 Tax=Congregibacter litoralis KT71 TaxID=314285 RepID=A4ACH0_9GAMM|nr:hypothetical protein [Congregibacter litoralis]EAQ96398.1 hypothetical protein KT71_13465 [Congregibacter litoralis KT71]
MIPVTHRNISAALVTGFGKTQDGRDRLITEHLGSVLAFDPETHTVATVGLTVQMAQKLDNFYINEGSGFYPKWAGFKRMQKSQLVESYREYLDKLSEQQKAHGHFIGLDNEVVR